MANIILNNEKNGIEIRFDGKPESSVITELKEYGFRWSVKQKMWYAKQSAERISFAEGLGDFSSPIRNKTEKNKNYSLWEMTRTDGIEDNYTLYHLHDTKEIAVIIRKHLRARFPMCKWSVRSDYNSISVDLIASPFDEKSDEVKAIMKYAEKFYNSYNYNNSDSMTDYFDVNYYGSCSIFWKYEQCEMTETESEMSRVFQRSKTEFETAEEIRNQKELKEFRKQREIEAAEAAKREKIRKAEVKTIEENCEVKEADYVVINALLKANKDNDLEHTEYYDEKQTRQTCQVSRDVHFSSDVYALFKRQLMSDFSFLKEMGGSKTDDLRIQSMTDYNMMSADERKTVEWYNYDCVAIYCDGELKLIIDPQGYSYARYVYIADEQSDIVETYCSDLGISKEEYQKNKELADSIEDVSTEIIMANDIKNTWQEQDFELYKASMKNWLYSNKFKLNAGIVRAITISELKTAMYKVLTEVDSISEQFNNANLEAGRRLTVIQINDFGMMSVSRVTFSCFEIGTYAQYKNAVKFTFKPERKKNLYYRWLYRDVLIYDGWFELPENVLFEEVKSNISGVVYKKTKYLSCDNRQYNAVLEYFASKGIKPIINTYKPQF